MLYNQVAHLYPNTALLTVALTFLVQFPPINTQCTVLNQFAVSELFMR